MTKPRLPRLPAPSARVRRGCRAGLPALLLVVSWLAFAPATPSVEPFAHWDKTKHLLAFATLAFVAGVGWLHARAAPHATAVGLLAFGVFIELVQSRIPSRDASLADVLADVLGIALGLGLVRPLVPPKPTMPD